jgi:hypothetical protein
MTRVNALLLAVGLAVPRAALGQGESGLDTSPSPWARPGGEVTPPQGRSGQALTQPQLDAFAQLTGDESEVVLRRLSGNPGLIPWAAAAADARIARRSSGSAMVIGGYTVFGLGVIIGGVLLLSGLTPSSDCPWEGGSDCQSSGNDGTVHAGLAIIALSAVIGPALAIPGHVKVARTTQVEADALDRYEDSARVLAPSAPPSEVRSVRGRSTSKSLVLPLLSISF